MPPSRSPCLACQTRQRTCLPSAQGTRCAPCAVEDITCSLLKKASKRKRDDPDVDPARRRWDLNQLSGGTYSSSKDLYADISKIRKNERRRPASTTTGPDSTSIPGKGRGGGKRKQGQKASASRSKDGTVAPAASTKRNGRRYERLLHKVTEGVVQTMELGDSSLDSQLGMHQLAMSLGDHLLSLGIDYSQTIIKGIGSHRLPSSYTSYRQLKTENSKTITDFADIWISYALMLGVKWTTHSAVLGSLSLPSIPRTSLLEKPLDLRSQGYLRHGVRMQLLQRCVMLASAPDSPLTEQPSISSLAVLLSIISSAQSQCFGHAKPLIATAFEVFRKLRERKLSTKENMELLESFQMLYVYDTSLHMAYGELPSLTDDVILNSLQGLDSDPEVYIDPFYFSSHQERLFKNVPFSSEIHHYAIRRYFAFARDRIKRGLAMSEEAQHLCFELMQLCANYRIWRQSTFQLIPESLEEVADREQPILRSAVGEEGYSASFFTQGREARMMFFIAELLELCKQKFLDNPAFDEMTRTVEIACDQQVHFCLDMFAILLDRNEKLPRPMLDEGFSGKVHIIFTNCIDTSYLVGWGRRFPERRPLIERLMQIMKHLSFFSKETADRVAILEALDQPATQSQQEAEIPHSSTSNPDVEDLRTHRRDVRSQTLDSFTGTPSPHQFSPGLRTDIRSPSPSIWDFHNTLKAITSPASETPSATPGQN
ncbi:hypothetical protein BT69DRAFT_1284458 [Atractiella rhizophila]|nr:hypothetical protein BT69DRAFT_1284458 [Atractiella rhizophila]